jgi:tetratricopeptide (TPR) repeat protein
LVLAGCGTTSSKSDRPEKRTSRRASASQQTQAPSPPPAIERKAEPSAGAAGLDPQTEATYKRAVAAMKSDQPSSAEPLLARVLEARPDYSEARTNLGILLFKAGRYAQAEEEFKRAIADSPGNAVAHNYLGILYRVKGQFPEAKAAYERAIVADSQYALAYLNLGILSDLYLRDLNRALAYYQKYLQLVGTEDKDVANWIADLKRRMETGK